MQKFYFILKSVLTGLLLYALIGLLIAFVIVTYFGSNHPHGIDEILYFIIPFGEGITGATLGLIFSLVYLPELASNRVRKMLLLGLIVFVPATLLFLFG